MAFFPETWVENQLFGAIPCMFCTQGLEGLLEQVKTGVIPPPPFRSATAYCSCTCSKLLLLLHSPRLTT